MDSELLRDDSWSTYFRFIEAEINRLVVVLELPPTIDGSEVHFKPLTLEEYFHKRTNLDLFI